MRLLARDPEGRDSVGGGLSLDRGCAQLLLQPVSDNSGGDSSGVGLNRGGHVTLRQWVEGLWRSAAAPDGDRAEMAAAPALLPAGPPPSSAAAAPCPPPSAAATALLRKRRDAAGNPAHRHRPAETCRRPAPRCRCRTCRRNWRRSPSRSPSAAPSSARKAVG